VLVTEASEQTSHSVDAIPTHGPIMELKLRRSICPQRTLLLGGTLLILLGVVLGLIVRDDRVFPGELSLLQWMHQPSSGPLDRIA
jgi:hypothetical protein